jgi:SAM-dependent methyltransferase
MTTDFWADFKDAERDGQKLSTGPAERNRGPILEALRSLLPEAARVLEIGSGTGQHAAYFTSEWPTLGWQPTELSTTALVSVEAYRQEGDATRFLSPLPLDVTRDPFPTGPWDGVFSANVIHIAPWSVCEAIVQKAAGVLAPGGHLVLYGPFRFSGSFTAPSNAAFDARLRERDETFGIRDVDDIRRVAEAAGLSAPRVLEMPANNHVIAFSLPT